MRTNGSAPVKPGKVDVSLCAEDAVLKPLVVR
jgi:hypothetical protein